MKFYSKKIYKVALVFVLLITILSVSINAQSASNFNQKNAILVEGLGHGFAYSLNYERVLWSIAKTHTTGQIGIAYYGKASGFVPLWMPISLNQSIRLGENKFVEVGVGKMFRNDGVQLIDGSFENGYELEEWIFRLGYKQFFKEKWLFKVAYTPIYMDKSDFIHWGGAALGYRF